MFPLRVGLCTEKPTFVLSFIYMCAIIWPPAPLKMCYLARHLKEVARAWSIQTLNRMYNLTLLILCTIENVRLLDKVNNKTNYLPVFLEGEFIRTK